jgi:hypothetical protein
MREKTLLRETYRKGTQVNKDQLPTTRHTLVYQPREMHLLAAGVVQRGDERLEYHDVRLYFPHTSESERT